MIGPPLIAFHTGGKDALKVVPLHQRMGRGSSVRNGLSWPSQRCRTVGSLCDRAVSSCAQHGPLAPIYENAAAEFAQEWAVDIHDEIGSEIVNLKMVQPSSFDPKSLSPFELLQNIYLSS